MNSRAAVFVTLKLAVLCVFIAQTSPGFQSRIELLLGQNRLFTLTVFIAIWAVSIAAVLVAALQRSIVLRLLWASVISITTAIGYGYFVASGAQLTVFDGVSLWHAREDIGRAYDYYNSIVAQAGIVGLIGFVAMIWPPPNLNQLMDRLVAWLSWTPALPIGLIVAIVSLKTGGGSQALPQQFTPAAIGLVVLHSVARERAIVRQSVPVAPTSKPTIRHIVLLVDESIRADALDWTPQNVATPNLARYRDKFADFGVAVAGGNCSHYANAILRLGGSAANLTRSVNSSPTIWEYAKKAGFTTVYIDAQASQNKNPGRLQNFMTIAEANFIDEFQLIENVETAQLDRKLLQILTEKLRAPAPSFIYANKNGAHFPFDKSYPKSAVVFSPTYDQMDNSTSRTQGRINSYRNAVRWSVDGFFSQLFATNTLQSTAIIYTSDHGQNFASGKLTHCSVHNAHPLEGLVPLMFVSGDQHLMNKFRTAAQMNFNRANHFAIFPTVLQLFGYGADFVRATYGRELGTRLDAQSAFSSGDIFGLFGNAVHWNQITDRMQYFVRRLGSGDVGE